MFMSQTAAHNVAFIFDCDGTLVNSTPVWAYAQPELLHRHGVDVTVDDFAQFEHLSLEDECQAYHDTWGIGANGEELYRELSNILIDGYSKVPPRGGLLAFLEQAKAAGINIPIIPGIKPFKKISQLSMIPKTFKVDLPEDLVKEALKCKNDAEAEQVGVEWCVAQCKELMEHGVPSIHFYSIGAVDSIKEIAKIIY
jgi:hypothetical protein